MHRERRGEACKGCGEHADARWQRKADSRPGEIMDAAIAVFGEKGYRALRLDDVAARAGVTKPLIYHYFADKDDLIRKTLASRMEAFAERIRVESGSAGGDWEARLRHLLEFFWERWEAIEWNRFHDLLAEVRSENPELYRNWIERSVGERVKAVRGLLEEGRGDLVQGVDLDAAAAFLVCGAMKLVHLQTHIGSGPILEFEPGALRDSILDVFLRGVRARGSQRRPA